MKGPRSLLFLVPASVFMLAGSAVLISETAAFGQARAAKRPPVPEFITLSVDQKLLAVSWRCRDGLCGPWFLTQVMDRADQARSHTLRVGLQDDAVAEYIISETRQGLAWPRPQESVILTLPIDQRLVSVSWACGRNGDCAPSFLTRTMRRSEETVSYIFTNGETEYHIRETRD